MTTKTTLDPPVNLPVGALVDVGVAREPKAVVLKGRFGRIEKLDPLRHRADLWFAFEGHDHIWTYMPYGPFADGEAFGLWLKARSGIPDPFSYVVIDRDGHACGIIALMAVRPEMRVIEVGNVLLAPSLQRTALATEAQYLLARHVFETLGYRRYEWKCDSRNAASRRAALRLGFNFEGLSWQHMIVKAATATPPGTRCSMPNGRRKSFRSSAGSRSTTLMPRAARRSASPTRRGQGRRRPLIRSPDGAKRNPGSPYPHSATLHSPSKTGVNALMRATD